MLGNIAANLFEVIRYVGSNCELDGIYNIMIYLNQMFYVFGKFGSVSLLIFKG